MEEEMGKRMYIPLDTGIDHRREEEDAAGMEQPRKILLKSRTNNIRSERYELDSLPVCLRFLGLGFNSWDVRGDFLAVAGEVCCTCFFFIL